MSFQSINNGVTSFYYTKPSVYKLEAIISFLKYLPNQGDTFLIKQKLTWKSQQNIQKLQINRLLAVPWSDLNERE